MASYKVEEDICNTCTKGSHPKKIRNSYKLVRKNPKEKWTKLVNGRATILKLKSYFILPF